MLVAPASVNVYVPAATLPLDETVRTEEPTALMEDGEKLASMPEGNPLAVSDTVSLNPFKAATLTVKLVPSPGAIVAAAGDADSEKSGVRDEFETTTLKYAV